MARRGASKDQIWTLLEGRLRQFAESPEDHRARVAEKLGDAKLGRWFADALAKGAVYTPVSDDGGGEQSSNNAPDDGVAGIRDLAAD